MIYQEEFLGKGSLSLNKPFYVESVRLLLATVLIKPASTDDLLYYTGNLHTVTDITLSHDCANVSGFRNSDRMQLAISGEECQGYTGEQHHSVFLSAVFVVLHN